MGSRRGERLSLPAVLLTLSLFSAPVLAAGSDIAGTGTSPAVARVSTIQRGSVSITRSGTAAAVAATVNTPLLPGDAFASADRTQAEIQFDGSTSLRLGANARGEFVSADAASRHIRLTGGLAELALLRGGGTTVVEGPAFSVRTRYAGDYRISVANDASEITARSGQADVVTPQKTYTVVAGQTLVVGGAATAAHVLSGGRTATDAFDVFNAQRDRLLVSALTDDTHVPSSIAGYDDLDAYGHWADTTSYGQAWVPNQTAGWAPYRDGQWTPVNGYGMAWVGNEPWGWVPYHYGRWTYVGGNGWCWFPPGIATTPVWAPGLVGFFGYGTGVFGYSGMGWVPLAPYETYYPWYPWSWYASAPPRKHYYPPPPPPPGRHRRKEPSAHVNPLSAAFGNARFGGASAIGARAWHAGDFAHPIAVDPRNVGAVAIVRGHLPLVGERPTKPVAPQRAKADPPSANATLRGWNATLSPLQAAPAMHPSEPGGHGSMPLQLPAPVIHAPPVMHVPAPVLRAPAPVAHPAPPPASHSGPSSARPPV